MDTRRLLGKCARWSALGIICLSTLQASYIQGTINNGANGGICGSNNPGPFEVCTGAPDVPTVSLSALFSDAQGSYDAKTTTGYGLNRVFVSSAATNSGIQAATEWLVAYTLTGAPVGTPVDLLVELGYDVSVGTTGSSFAGFRMVLNNDVYSPFDISTTGNGFGSDNCFDRPGQTAIGACAGRHTGTTARTIAATVGPNNRLSLGVTGGTFGTGFVDAYHTVTIRAITVPDGIGWQYQGLTGNPLNFQYAATTAPVPEPAAFGLMGVGISVLALAQRKKRAAKV